MLTICRDEGSAIGLVRTSRVARAMTRSRGLPIPGADSKGIFSAHESGSEITAQYQRAQHAQHECEGFPGNEDHHSATSGKRGNVRLGAILPPKSVQVIREQPSADPCRSGAPQT